MVSSLNLAYFQKLFGGDEWFGSRNILFVGNLQLQPVGGSPAFERIATKSLLFQQLLTFGKTVVYDELTINE